MHRVPYEDLRLGDIGFVAGEGFLSKAITRLTRRSDLRGIQTPSHAFVICSRTQVIEALDKTKIRPLAVYSAAFKAGRALAFRPPGTLQAKRVAMQSFVREYLNASYGWMQIMGFLPVLWARKRFGGKMANPAPGGEICSEISVLWLWRLQMSLHMGGEREAADRLAWVDLLDRDTTDPALLLAFCLQNLSTENK